MEDKKTFFDYMGQFFATYGIIVTIFMGFGEIVGKEACELSSLFSLGKQGLSLETLFQLFVFSAIITLAQITFLTDKWIRSMSLIFRNVCFFVCIVLVMISFVVLFNWFPINEIRAWFGFFASFMLCSLVGITISRWKEKVENKKMEKALSKFQKD